MRRRERRNGPISDIQRLPPQGHCRPEF